MNGNNPVSPYYSCTDCGKLYRLKMSKDPDNMMVYICRKCGEMICKDCRDRTGMQGRLMLVRTAARWIRESRSGLCRGRELGKTIADFLS
jgi:NAD-dependent SIR2 family protein deacetylase